MGILTKYLEREREKRMKPFTKGVVLDIGCGPAHAINYPGVTDYFGFDINEKNINKLKEKYPQYHFSTENLENDKIKLSKKVDTVIMSAFLEHIENYENPVREALRNLNDNGKILITTPTKFGHKVHAIGANLGLFSKEAKEDHKAILGKKDFVRMAEKYNLKLKKFKYFQLFCNQFVVYEK